MLQPRRQQKKLSLVQKTANERRIEWRTRIEPLSAAVSDLYRERFSAYVLNVSTSGVGLKTSEKFKVNFPVLIECRDLLILGTVRHCLPSSDGQYLLGVEIHRALDRAGIEVERRDRALENRLICQRTMRSAG